MEVISPVVPLLSVIVPVYNVEPYVRQCLDSILSQPGIELEVVAVDDGSTDGSARVLQDLASDPRLRVISLDENAGLGNARNVGLAHAGGEYVMFVDSDDYLVPNMLDYVVDRAVTTTADVVVFDYSRVGIKGKESRNVTGPLLASAPRSPFTIEEYPELFEVLNVAWNKVYRREFLSRVGLSFPDGFYEDIPWTYPILIQARSIVTVDLSIYRYRQRIDGNILRTRSKRHFDVLSQYDRLMSWVRSNPEASRYESYFYRKFLDHALGVFAGGMRLPRRESHTYFTEACDVANRHRPASHEAAAGLTGLRHRLLAGGHYRPYVVLKAANRTVRALRKIAKELPRAMRNGGGRLGVGILRTLYRMLARLLPVDPRLVVFSAYWDSQYSGNPRALYEAFVDRDTGHKLVWLVKRGARSAIPDGVRCVLTGSPRYFWVLARAGVVISNANLPDFVRKKTGSVHLQTHHGTPLKSMGMDLMAYPAAEDMDFDKLLKRCSRWDLALSSNPHSSEINRGAFPVGFANLELGYPRNDVLVRGDSRVLERLRLDLDVPVGKKIALYAPTFRHYQRRGDLLIDPRAVQAALGEEYVLVVRPHYWRRVGVRRGQAVIDGSKVDAQALLLASDVLITDYSSMMFDYAILERPIVIYAPDLKRYTKERGIYFDIVANAPGVVAEGPLELERVLRDRSFESADSAIRLKQFRDRFCPWDDGHASERVLDAVLGVAATS